MVNIGTPASLATTQSKDLPTISYFVTFKIPKFWNPSLEPGGLKILPVSVRVRPGAPALSAF